MPRSEEKGQVPWWSWCKGGRGVDGCKGGRGVGGKDERGVDGCKGGRGVGCKDERGVGCKGGRGGVDGFEDGRGLEHAADEHVCTLDVPGCGCS